MKHAYAQSGVWKPFLKATFYCKLGIYRKKTWSKNVSHFKHTEDLAYSPGTTAGKI